MSKPFAPSADRNKAPILEVLKPLLSGKPLVLELGSGTGQHACFLAAGLPDVVWQPTELAGNIDGIRQWLAESDLSNVREPVVLDVDVHPWPVDRADVCFTCNTFHIVSEASVRSIFEGARAVLGATGKLCVYGPFMIDGQHVGPGNRDFHQWLLDSDPESGVRDLTELDELAKLCGFAASQRIEMPANNFMVVWERARTSGQA